MSSGFYKDSSLLNSLAMASAGENRSQLREFRDYANAIGDFLERISQRPALTGFMNKLTSWMPTSSRADKKPDAKMLRQIITGREQEELCKIHKEFFTTTLEVLPSELKKMADAEQNPGIREDLLIICQRLGNPDKVAVAAMYVEFLQHQVVSLALGTPGPMDPMALSRGDLYALAGVLAAETVIPGLIERDTKILTVEFLNNLSDFGLIEVSRVWVVLSPYISDRVSDAYHEKHLGYRAEPKRDEVTSIPYDVRMQEYNALKSAYKSRKQEILEMMVRFAQEAGFKEGREWNNDWLIGQASQGSFLSLYDAIAEHPTAQKIIAYNPTFQPLDKLKRTETDILRDNVRAMRLVIEFAQQNPAQHLYLLQQIAEDIYVTALGLYRLKDKK
jgi:hypothetical protein